MTNGIEVTKSGTILYFKDSWFHREDGPAVEWKDGKKEDCANNKCDKKCPEDVEMTGMICKDCLALIRGDFDGVGHA